MRKTLTVAPMTRVEGHLDISVTIDVKRTSQRVVAARSSGTMFRGFELILRGRDPLDAPHYTQRICGVCPISHGMAASKNLEAAMGIAPTDNGRILRNLVLGANFVQSHILHFYHLAALDYIDTSAFLPMSPWLPRYVTPDMDAGSLASGLVAHYVEALGVRRTAHQMGAIFGGKLPCSPTLVPGGCSETATDAKIEAFGRLLGEVRTFIDGTLLPDVEALGAAFPEYRSIGRGCGNLLAYGVFDLDGAGSLKLQPRGRFTNGEAGSLDLAAIREYVRHSKYRSSSGRKHPSVGSTSPITRKSGAYSWIKAPRYGDVVHEVGPLARMWVSGDYREGISVVDRLTARALEAKKIADAMVGWLEALRPGEPGQERFRVPETATSVGLTEAPRGALGHWMTVSKSRIAKYQVVAPTGWNASPKDDFGHNGPIEQALIGLDVADMQTPIEVMRVVHSFDPCLACSVHVARPGKKPQRVL
ncbi:nickel-dependent hydrogenase large subunit [bacterium]|nr:nickel-dependent hydrogenase large subunit [bacterium]